ncbi:L,D-transpeptidase family protein [Methylocaldum sp. MU1018]
MKFRSVLSAIPLLLSLNAGASEKDESIWLLVETVPHVLKVMAGDRDLEVFEKIAIGRHGAGLFKERGDYKTPLGEYRIGWINENSRYHRFFGFTYPNRENAERAYELGLIGLNTYRTILRTSIGAAIPPQNTALGGQIGIHGLGRADLAVHQNFDWTQGCVAMTNEQIDRLSAWVKKGTLVVIR